MDCFALTAGSAFRIGFIALVGIHLLRQLFRAVRNLLSVGGRLTRDGEYEECA